MKALTRFEAIDAVGRPKTGIAISKSDRRYEDERKGEE
jgi:hypothetical protein